MRPLPFLAIFLFGCGGSQSPDAGMQVRYQWSVPQIAQGALTVEGASVRGYCNVDGGSVALNGTLTNGWLALSGDGLRIEGPSCGGTWRVTLGRTDEVVAASVNP